MITLVIAVVALALSSAILALLLAISWRLYQTQRQSRKAFAMFASRMGAYHGADLKHSAPEAAPGASQEAPTRPETGA